MVRHGRESDLSQLKILHMALLDVHHQGYPDLFPAPPEEIPDETMREMFFADNALVLVCEKSGKISGYAYGTERKVENSHFTIERRYIQVNDLYVLPECRKQGIGRALLEACREHSLKRGISTLEIGVYAFNQDALVFYNKLGYTPYAIRLSKKIKE